MTVTSSITSGWSPNTLRALAALVLSYAVLPAPCALAIPCLSGFVRDAANQPVAGGDLDFTVSATGQRLVTPGDNTDAGGFYSVCVLPNVYDVSFAPAPGSRLMGRLIPGFNLTADIGVELDVTLTAGTVVTGVVRDRLGQPVGTVDTDVDQTGVGRVFTPSDNSDPVTGIYRVVIPNGQHRFRWSPPRGSRLRGMEMDSVVVSSDQTLDVTLEDGLLLSGRVTDSGSQGVFDVTIDLRRLGTGLKVFLSHGATDAAGDYIVSTPAGDYELRYVPPRASHLVAAAVDSFSVSGDLQRDQSLATGHRVVVEILDADGQPLVSADLDVTDPLTGAKLFTPHDTSDAAGRTVAVLPNGTYDLDVEAPLGSSLAPAVRTGVVVGADTTIVVQLEAEPRVTVSGRILDGNGAGIADAVFRLRRLSDGVEVALGTDTSAPDGSFALDVPTGRLEVLVAPPTGAHLAGLRLPEVTVTNDSLWGDLVLAVGQLVEVTVLDDGGLPVANADLDLVAPESGLAIYTPRDNTDAAGRAVVTAPAGSYSLLVTPTAGSGLGTLTVTSFTVAGDTTLTVTLERSPGTAVPVSIDLIWPNPATGPARIAYSLAGSAAVTMAVHDARGRLVQVLADGPRDAGPHEETWNGTTASGARAPSGVYFVHLKTSRGDQARRLTVVH